VQEGPTDTCRHCGCPVTAPTQVYRRQPDGTWSVVEDIDLSALAPKPTFAPRKLISRGGAAMMLAVVLACVVLSLWSRRNSQGQAQREAEAIRQYLGNPVGTIVPRFELNYDRGVRGELRVWGLTNLPEATALEVQVYAGDLLVAVDYPVVVVRGTFRTRPLLHRGRPFSFAPYRVRIRATFDEATQPPSVLLVVGKLGERLQSPHVHRDDVGLGARLDFTEEFVLSQ